MEHISKCVVERDSMELQQSCYDDLKLANIFNNLTEETDVPIDAVNDVADLNCSIVAHSASGKVNMRETRATLVPCTTPKELHSSVPLSYLIPLPDSDPYVHLNFSNYRQFYDRVGPIRFQTPLSGGMKSPHVELRLWNDDNTRLISQNSSKRRVYNIYWLPKIFSNIALRAAIKFVEDYNIRDGRSIKREIECHLYMYQKLLSVSKANNKPSLIFNDDWPSVEVLGYFLDKKEPGQSTLVTRKLTGPDFFYIIRSENMNGFSSRITPIYEFNKLDWCITALNRIAQFGAIGIRHNDIKPDNIVLDVYFDTGVKKVDVKIIDLGAASMEFTREFTGGTPWYESPEQKLLEFYTKKHRGHARAQTVAISKSSDAWGAGLSIVEVLVGKRVVDYIKAPYGPGSLEFKGAPDDDIFVYSTDIKYDRLWWNKDEYWATPPQVWIQHAKRVLNLDKTPDRYSICHHAAKFVFDKLVVVDPNKRSPVKEVASSLRRFVTEAISQHL
ncbi:hypothetical protein BEWA_021970 [Theileria equi strain WA]|uniref:Protein kinase domain-containing protein n=1 Tax=Theileria equi strain WA TaxID=1537102 RepID=L0AWS2_THEEQ|nr:hypothetical protein BEWA_021970 [Theileria equi strain WA]AFZ79349.1 hypothetical protein BEWA_021970 [Theileria equi strain WA]|eukprot:XP_004829015.1 hypothetical protein BEWA_021970 [Theileria equi strain WA]